MDDVESLKQQLSDLQQRYDTVYNVVQEWKNAHIYYQESIDKCNDAEDDPLNPIERLRFLCSIAFAGDTWLFSERLFDDIVELVIPTPVNVDQLNTDDAYGQLFWRNTPLGIEHKLQWELVKILRAPDGSLEEVGVLSGVTSSITNSPNWYIPLIQPETAYYECEQS